MLAWALGDIIWDSRKEGPQLDWVEVVLSTDAAAQIQTKWVHGGDGIGNVARIKSTGQKERDADRITDSTAQVPVVRASSASQLFNVQIQIAGVEQQGVHMRRRGDRIIHRCGIGNVDDLNQRDTRQRITEMGININRQMLAKLNCVGATTTLLRNDRVRRLLAGKQKGGDRRRHSGGYL